MWDEDNFLEVPGTETQASPDKVPSAQVQLMDLDPPLRNQPLAKPQPYQWKMGQIVLKLPYL